MSDEPIEHGNASDGYSDEHESQVLNILAKQRFNPRTRAAPLYNELLPDWRARARDFSSSYQRSSVHADARSIPCRTLPRGDTKEVPSTMDAKHIPGLESNHDRKGSRRRDGRSGSPEEETGKEVRLDLEHEQGRARGAGSKGSGHEPNRRRERKSDNFTRETSSSSGDSGENGGSIKQGPKGILMDESRRTASGSDSSRSSGTRESDTTSSHGSDSRRRRHTQFVVTPDSKCKQCDTERGGGLGHGSESTRAAESSISTKEKELKLNNDDKPQQKMSLFTWAGNFIGSVAKRSQTLTVFAALMQRVFHKRG